MALPLVIGSVATSMLGAFGGWIAKLLSIETIKFLAWRAFILFIVFVCLPLVLYNVGVDLMFDLMEVGMGYAGDLNQQSLTIQLTGMAGWMATQLNLPQCFSMYMSAVSVRFAMGFVPFLR
jgi:hypothetical protein